MGRRQPPKRRVQLLTIRRVNADGVTADDQRGRAQGPLRIVPGLHLVQVVDPAAEEVVVFASGRTAGQLPDQRIPQSRLARMKRLVSAYEQVFGTARAQTRT